MDHREQQGTQYEAPKVEDVETAEGPASVSAGVKQQVPSGTVN